MEYKIVLMDQMRWSAVSSYTICIYSYFNLESNFKERWLPSNMFKLQLYLLMVMMVYTLLIRCIYMIQSR